MFDLHCHLLPGIDDGAADLDTAIGMARMAVADGIETIACTTHIYPGMYDNTAAGIGAATARMQGELDRRGIPLQLRFGADVYLEPGLAASIRGGRVPTLGGSRYLLLEPPHHVAPPNFEQAVFDLVVAGHVPVITHPERLTWTHDHYAVFARMARNGAWMQVTSGSLVGRFGHAAQRLGERMLDDGLVHILATDAHDLRRRPPLLAEGRERAARHVGDVEALHMVSTRPRGMLEDVAPDALPPLPDAPPPTGWMNAFFGRQRRSPRMDTSR